MLHIPVHEVMEVAERDPDELSERELFTEYVQLIKQSDIPADGYEEVRLHERQARLLAEIGERLEALEAAKALIGEPNRVHEGEQHASDERPFESQHFFDGE